MSERPPDMATRPHRWLRSQAAVPAMVFVITLLVTGALVASVAHAIRRQDRLTFEYEVARAQEAIGERIAITTSLLRGAAGLLEGSDTVTSAEFRRYVDRLELRTRYPGILGIGFTRELAAGEVAPFEAAMRAAGQPTFRVWPRMPRHDYQSIVYLEPMDRRNAAAIGYDMSTEPVRRAAMDAARARGDVVASGKVTLVQEIDRNKQSGLLLYLPIYPHGTDRPAGAPRGFVYAPLRVGDLLAGTRGPGPRRIDYVAYDGLAATPATELYSTIHAGDPPSARFAADHVVQVAGRPWLVRFYSRPELDALSRWWLVPWLGLAAVVASALLASLSWLQGRARRTAEAAAGEQQRIARALHREREWLGATLTSIGDGVIAVDGMERVTWMNPVAARLTGWERDAALGRPLGEVLRATTLPGGGAGAGALADGSGQGEAMVQARDGGERPVAYSRAPIRDPLGAASGAVIVMRDASERYRVEAELRENDRRKDEFLAMLAHELRNPLAPIGTAAALLRLPELAPAQRHEAGEVIARQVGHMTELVDDLLDVSRVTRGAISLDMQLFDMREAIGTAVEQARTVMEHGRHVLEAEVAASPLWVCGDRTRLTQVLANLLDNAAKYTPAGGCIHLRAGHADGRVRVSVRDTGIGIDRELLPRVFDLFTQGQRALDRAQGGLGIGLALVRRVVELHRGTVGVDSAGAGEGSEFTVDLPAADAPSPVVPVAVPADEAAGATGPLDIVVVDDNEDALRTMAFLLEAYGHRVRTYGTAEAALLAADTDPARVYILDIGLPGMSGLELARRLRAHPRTAGAVLLALSGYGQAADLAASHEAGFEQHLTKPVDPDHLLRVLQARTGHSTPA